MEKFKLQLSKLMDKYNFEVIEFNYYNKIFGNIVLRIKKEDKIDKEVGFVLNKKVGDKVEKGEILGYIHANDEEKGKEIQNKDIYEIV